MHARARGKTLRSRLSEKARCRACGISIVLNNAVHLHRLAGLEKRLKQLVASDESRRRRRRF